MKAADPWSTAGDSTTTPPVPVTLIDRLVAAVEGDYTTKYAVRLALEAQERELMGIVDGVLLDLDQTKIRFGAELAQSDDENHSLREDINELTARVWDLHKQADAVLSASEGEQRYHLRLIDDLYTALAESNKYLGMFIDAYNAEQAGPKLSAWLTRAGASEIAAALGRQRELLDGHSQVSR